MMMTMGPLYKAGLLVLCFSLHRSSTVNTFISAFTPPVTQHCDANNVSRQLSSTAVASTVKNNEIVSSMPPPLPTPLRNHFYLLRHGQSTANVANVISSARSLMYSDKHGLTELGEQQGRNAADQMKTLLLLNDDSKTKKLTFYSSPFARARQTAQACLDSILETNDKIKDAGMSDWKVTEEVLLNDGLIERYFGRLDDTDIRTYSYVWPVDMLNVTHTEYDVESVAAVATRIRDTIANIDAQHGPDEHIVLVSHADVLQITQLYATITDINDSSNINVGSFSSYRFGNGEVRAVGRSPKTLPDPAPLEMPEW